MWCNLCPACTSCSHAWDGLAALQGDVLIPADVSASVAEALLFLHMASRYTPPAEGFSLVSKFCLKLELLAACISLSAHLACSLRSYIRGQKAGVMGSMQLVFLQLQECTMPLASALTYRGYASHSLEQLLEGKQA